jgi:hypothetical protein
LLERTNSSKFKHFSYHNGLCWICGAARDLTREHKIKHSDIKRYQGAEQLFIGHLGENMKLAQSAKSTAFKFNARICNECNSSRTQPADLAYDEFIRIIESNGSTIEAFEAVLNRGEFAFGTSNYLSIARYFAKLLGNHMADADFPIPISLKRFVLNETPLCNLQLFGSAIQPESADRGGAGGVKLTHGGLVVIQARGEATPRRLHSCRNVGRFQFAFQYEFSEIEKRELREFHKEFCDQCFSAFDSEITLKTTSEEWRNLGIDVY